MRERENLWPYVAEKVTILGTDYMEKLTELIAEDQIPPFLGGKGKLTKQTGSVPKEYDWLLDANLYKRPYIHHVKPGEKEKGVIKEKSPPIKNAETKEQKEKEKEKGKEEEEEEASSDSEYEEIVKQ